MSKIPEMKNKVIFDFKMAVTNSCFFRCKYCFVRKGNIVMTFSTAKKIIDFVMSLPPKEKIFRIYGGEPLLHLSLIERIAEYARLVEKEKNKNLTLSLCTNGILLDANAISVMKKYGLRLAVSFDGKQNVHEKYRQFKDKRHGGYAVIRMNIENAIEKLGRYNVAASFGVPSTEVGQMYENFKLLIETGFDSVNIEPIHAFSKWDNNRSSVFYTQLLEIIKYIVHQIPKKKFIFLTTINRELKYKILSKQLLGICPFYRLTEFTPKGEIGFSPFLLNAKDKAKYVIGNINDEISFKYLTCKYIRNSKGCLTCVSSYFQDQEDNDRECKVIFIRNKTSISAANFIKRKATSNILYRSYFREAVKHICF